MALPERVEELRPRAMLLEDTEAGEAERILLGRWSLRPHEKEPEPACGEQRVAPAELVPRPFLGHEPSVEEIAPHVILAADLLELLHRRVGQRLEGEAWEARGHPLFVAWVGRL